MGRTFCLKLHLFWDSVRSISYIIGIITVLILQKSLLVAQDNVEFRGQVLGVSDSLPIPFVNIYTEGYKKFASSSIGGNFSIYISNNDTLNFSAVGFRPQKLIAYPISGIQHKIYLSQVTYELPGLIIYGKNPMVGFFEHDRLYNPKTERTFEQKFPKPSLGVTPGGASVTGLFTALANQFNSEYQQLKKLGEIKKDEYPYFRRLELVHVLLTPEYVTQNTSLQREEVKAFLDFWKPGVDFMEEANEYQLLTAVQQQEKKYIRQIKENNQGNGVVTTIELRKLLDNYKGN